MNVPGDNVVTDVISAEGDGSHDKSDGPTVLPSNSPRTRDWYRKTTRTRIRSYRGWRYFLKLTRGQHWN